MLQLGRYSSAAALIAVVTSPVGYAAAQPAGPQPVPAAPSSGPVDPAAAPLPPPEQPPPPPAPFAPPPQPPPPPPPMAPPPMFWQPTYAPAPPSAMEEAQRPGIGKAGIPTSHRGGLRLELSAVGDGEQDVSGGSMLIAPSIPLAERTFLDVRLPLGFATGFALGNPTLNLRHVVRANRSVFVTLGGGLGLPLLNDDTQDRRFFEVPNVAKGLYDFHEFYPFSVPLRFGAGVEAHVGELLILRLNGDLTAMFNYGDNDEPEVAFQHAGEIQLGHTFGGGLRVQGVALPTFESTGVRSEFEGDLYQLALEPYFAYEGDLLFARVGLLLPLDEQLGPPFSQSYAFRLATGFRID